MDKGGLVAAAGGNCGCWDPEPINPYILYVSATDSSDNPASWSSRGNHIDVAAPGVGILTTTNGGGYGASSGTSFSSPITAGVLALMMSVNPTLKPSDIEALLKANSDDLGLSGWDPSYGFGRVNAYRAVNAAATSTPTPDTTPPTTSITFPADGATVSGTISVSASASDNVGVSQVELWKDGALFATDASSPYAFLWGTTTDPNGSHTLETHASDAAGNVGVSSAVTVYVNNIPDTIVPIVTIMQPANNSTLPSKGTVTISASASDNVGVTQLNLFFDGTIRKSCLGTAICTYKLNTNKVKPGTHTISARASDAAGNAATASITVRK
jgi:hypothetical protein